MINVDLYKPIFEFLALYFGSKTELILCDTEKILLIENASDPSKVIGAPISEMQQALIHNPECTDLPYNINYRTMGKDGAKMRSATMFIRENGKLEGLLTINQNVEELVNIRFLLDQMINGEQNNNFLKGTNNKRTQPKQSFETLTLSVSEIIDKVLAEATIRFNALPVRLNSQEKLSTIREMDNRGVFLAKGAVNEVAEKLGVSKATIYRYLHQIN